MMETRMSSFAYPPTEMGARKVLEEGQLRQAPPDSMGGGTYITAASAPRHCLALDTIEC